MLFSFIKKVLKRTFLRRLWLSYLVWGEERRTRKLNLFKQKVVKGYAKKRGLNVFIETGTYLGDMVEAMKNNFKEIYSIELDKSLYEKARKRFQEQKHIKIFQEDSAQVLPNILYNIKEPCLFWLDAHYSGGFTAKAVLETPIRQELEAILSHPIRRHTILIDDARCFLGTNDYPTIDELKELIKKNSNYAFKVKNDIIRITPLKK